MQGERTTRQKVKSIDWVTIVLVLTLVAFGTVTIANVLADPFSGDETSLGDIQAKLNMFYVQKHVKNFLFGVVVMLVMFAVDYEIYGRFIRYAYLANLALLALLIAMDKTSRGVAGWFDLGSMSFQPSEVCKVTLTIMLSKLAAEIYEKEGGIKSLRNLGTLLLYFLVPFLLVIWQPDFGTAVVYVAIFACILFVSKIKWKYILSAILAVAALAPVSYFYLFSDDQRERIQVFLDQTRDLAGSGLQVDVSKMAIGSGQMYGKGYFTDGTLAQLKHVPERHTDFIFAGVAEGLGFVGGTVLIVLFFALIARWMWVGYRAKDHFGTCMAVGLSGMMLAHVFENIGMTIGLMPVTGIPLPFVSYGGSNMLTNLMATGVILNIWFRRQHQRR
ncbi:rod shape-determining protein RodA [Christensenellaceae bacterium OttesenSCG-928-L17]|nr:rod shape-determining protein RodA [Christensenellaceae bacterium OttesenSCG-928-L17]